MNDFVNGYYYYYYLFFIFLFIYFYLFIYFLTARSQHHSHSSLPLPPQDHSFGPQHHHKQLPWGAPPPDDHWPVPPPPHHFSGGPQQHFPLMPPGSGAPPDPGVMQKDGSHRGRPFGAVQVNFKPMHVFQQQSRGFSSGGQGSSRGNWQGEQGSRSNYSLQNGRMGVSHRDQSAMERHHEGKSYKKFKTQTPSHRYRHVYMHMLSMSM